MVMAVRKEIHELSAEPGWRDHWNDEGFIPDYSRVKDRLEALLAERYTDEVLALGRELLEAGKLPQTSPSWPLPETGVIETIERRETQFPQTETLIDIAIFEKRPDDVIRWYDQRKSQGIRIALTTPKAYEVAAGYLRKAQRVLKKLGREKEWQNYLTELREANARKRRLLEILDSLAGRRIVEGL